MDQFKPSIRDGFELLQKQFALSLEQIAELDSQDIADAVICDLFLNHELHISDVATMANLSHETVTETLLKRQIVKDRRQPKGQAPNGVERRGALMPRKTSSWFTCS